MNGAEPDEVFMGTLTSNVRMLLDTYEQFTNGLSPLLRAFTERYDVRLNTATEELLIEHGRVTGVHVRHADGTTATLRGAGVILATPAHTSAALTARVLPRVSVELRSVSYYPVTLVLAEYDRPIFSSSARAFVFGDDEPVSNAGAYGINDRHLVRYTFSGRLSRGINGSTDPDGLIRLGEAALARRVPVEPRWRRDFVVKHFNPGLCAYRSYHGSFLDRLETQVQQAPGLYLTGDYLQGASIEACFRAASACVERIARQELPVRASVRTWQMADTATFAGCDRRISA
jgi:oxygen-dependent protoporphyrinogen oxidase